MRTIFNYTCCFHTYIYIHTYIYLAPLLRYKAPKILGSRPWPFGVTWRYRSLDRWTRHMWFPIGGPLEPCVYLAPLRRYWAPKIKGSRVWPFGVTWRHRSYVVSYFDPLPVGRSQKWPHIWNSRCHIAYSLYNFYGPTMTIRGRL